MALEPLRLHRRRCVPSRSIRAQATPVSFPILFDKDSKVSKLYAVQGMPNSVILDRKGNVRYVHRGYKPGEENEYLNQIRALIRE